MHCEIQTSVTYCHLVYKNSARVAFIQAQSVELQVSLGLCVDLLSRLNLAPTKQIINIARALLELLFESKNCTKNAIEVMK